MKWIDGTDIDLKQFSGEALCEKLALDMYKGDREAWECPEFLKLTMALLNFDAEISMEGFAAPHSGNLTAGDYAQIIAAFRAIGDEQDAEVLEKALQFDARYTKMIAEAEEGSERINLSDTLFERMTDLEQELYPSTDLDIWSMLYSYLDAQIAAL